MIKKLKEIFKQLDKMTYKIMKHGLKFCFAICILAVFILFTYHFTFPAPSMYYIGISLFRISLIFGIEFIIYDLVVDGIKKKMI